MRHLPGGTITSPKGFLAGATYAGIKTPGAGVLDLGILYSEASCVAAGLFTTNRIKGAPVVITQRHLHQGRARAVVVNSGCANAGTGEEGLRDALEMAHLVAGRLGLSPQEVLVASTGLVGSRLAMERLRRGIEEVVLSTQGGHDLARAILTTDPFPKERALTLELTGGMITVGGIAKGAGMIHPQLATMLCFLTTDAALEGAFLEAALREAVEASFNMITIDGDTSPNDTVLLLANGLAGNQPIDERHSAASSFREALSQLCIFLAREIVRGGEGATRLLEVRVEGATSLLEARQAARTVAGSNLVKAAVHGGDPNWGRILAALGRSGAEVEEAKLDLFLGELCLVRSGHPLYFDREAACQALNEAEVKMRICLNLGDHRVTAWGCDLSEEYVTLNSAYST